MAASASLAHKKAMEDLEAIRTKRSQREASVDTATAAKAAAEERELGQKRKRDECKASLAEAKQALKSARHTEKDTAAGRTNLYKHYAKADGSTKSELRAARQAVQESTEEQQKAFEAIRALKHEEYDANQVIVAYEAKHKPKEEV